MSATRVDRVVHALQGGPHVSGICAPSLWPSAAIDSGNPYPIAWPAWYAVSVERTLSRSDFDFALPDELIARHPPADRDAGRLFVVRRREGTFEHRRVVDLPDLLDPGDVLVVNDTKVLPARIVGRKEGSGGRVELLLVEPISLDSDRRWRAMAQASKPLRTGARVKLDGSEAEVATIEAVEGDGFVVVELSEDAAVLSTRLGKIPLPPYLGRDATPDDRERYQTVFADEGKAQSVAAPTAGLHFTSALLDRLAAQGVRHVAITLHVGPGTFLPIRSESLADHRMHSERYQVGERAAEIVESARSVGHRVVAVGSTSIRVLEAAGRPLRPRTGATDIFIRPGHGFVGASALLTNFHLPCSTLIVLVAAFAGHGLIMEAYREAIARRYRFFSYGDAMLIL